MGKQRGKEGKKRRREKWGWGQSIVGRRGEKKVKNITSSLVTVVKD